jgi:hypothetical protein
VGQVAGGWRETVLTGADDFRRVNPILSNDGTRLIYVRSGPAQVETDPQVSRTLALRTYKRWRRTNLDVSDAGPNFAHRLDALMANGS